MSRSNKLTHVPKTCRIPFADKSRDLKLILGESYGATILRFGIIRIVDFERVKFINVVAARITTAGKPMN